MTWNTNRSQRLPKDWAQRRAHIINRAHGQCEAHLHNGTRCTAPGTDVDHITHGDNHDLTNLQLLCTWHHKQKTRTEAATELTKDDVKNWTRTSRLTLTDTHPQTLNLATANLLARQLIDGREKRDNAHEPR